MTPGSWRTIPCISWRRERRTLGSAPTLSRFENARDRASAWAGNPDFEDKEWMVAPVPATVLSSYWNDGAIPDPNYGDNINAISDSFFYADFWYRDEFAAPGLPAGRHAWQIFRGLNWKADVYLNGALLGHIDGGFMRGEFDITKTLK